MTNWSTRPGRRQRQTGRPVTTCAHETSSEFLSEADDGGTATHRPFRRADGSRRATSTVTTRGSTIDHRFPAREAPGWHHGCMTFQTLRRVATELRSALADYEPERLSGTDAARMLELFSEIEKLASGGKIPTARR